ncbi:MAG: hypothetical protein L6V84_04965 [Oscillospiraceae bacterium]|nr:MAG: hypothetical protein L6V84_04965 [Oscillospiraceae bacterium]
MVRMKNCGRMRRERQELLLRGRRTPRRRISRGLRRVAGRRLPAPDPRGNLPRQRSFS